MKKKTKRVKIVTEMGTQISPKDMAETADRISKAMKKYKQPGFIPKTNSTKQTKGVKAILDEIDFRISIGMIRIKNLNEMGDIMVGKKQNKKLSNILDNKVNELKDLRKWIITNQP